MKKAKNIIVGFLDGEIARFDKGTITVNEKFIEIISTGYKHYIFPWNNVKKLVFEEENGSDTGTGRYPWGK